MYHLLIIDVGGRLIRRYDLGRADLRAGQADILWDTRDTQGRPVLSGIYLATVRGREESARKAVIVLR